MTFVAKTATIVTALVCDTPTDLRWVRAEVDLNDVGRAFPFTIPAGGDLTVKLPAILIGVR